MSRFLAAPVAVPGAKGIGKRSRTDPLGSVLLHLGLKITGKDSIWLTKGSAFPSIDNFCEPSGFWEKRKGRS